jgi:hypothetical protein
MKKNKLIKTLASITAMGAIGTGTAIGISSCSCNSGDTTKTPVITISTTASTIQFVSQGTNTATITSTLTNADGHHATLTATGGTINTDYSFTDNNDGTGTLTMLKAIPFSSSNIVITITASYSGAISQTTEVTLLRADITPLTIGTSSHNDLVTINGSGVITGLPSTGGVEKLSQYMVTNGYNTIIFDNTITGIGNNALRTCVILLDPLTRMPITFLGTTITSIGNYAFTNCVGITQINTPENTTITSIGTNAFENCQNLTGFENASSTDISSIGDYAFAACPSLTMAGINFHSIASCTQTATEDGAY